MHPLSLQVCDISICNPALTAWGSLGSSEWSPPPAPVKTQTIDWLIFTADSLWSELSSCATSADLNRNAELHEFMNQRPQWCFYRACGSVQTGIKSFIKYWNVLKTVSNVLQMNSCEVTTFFQQHELLLRTVPKYSDWVIFILTWSYCVNYNSETFLYSCMI